MDGGMADSVMWDSGPERGDSIVSGMVTLSPSFPCTRDPANCVLAFVFTARRGRDAPASLVAALVRLSPPPSEGKVLGGGILD